MLSRSRHYSHRIAYFSDEHHRFLSRLLSPDLGPLTLPRQQLIVDRKFDQVHSDLFSRSDSIFAICFSIRNFNILGDEISRPIHVIFNGDNFAQWSQAMCSYLKGRK